MSQKRIFLSKCPLITHCSVQTMSLQLDPANTVFMPERKSNTINQTEPATCTAILVPCTVESLASGSSHRRTSVPTRPPGHHTEPQNGNAIYAAKVYEGTERLNLLTDFAAQVPEFEGPVVAPRDDPCVVQQELGRQHFSTVACECVLRDRG